MQARSGELWWSTLADDSYSSSIYLFQSKYIITEDPLSVASQHSSALFLPSAGSAWQELKERYSRISELRLQDLKRVTVYFWTLQEKTHITQSDLVFFILACLAGLSSSELLSCVHGADTSISTCSSEKSPIAWQSSCADTSPKWEVSAARAIGRVGNIASQKQVEEPWVFRKETKSPCKQQVGSFAEALWQMTPIRAAFICSKACDSITEDALIVASQNSSALFLRSAGSAWQEMRRYLWISELRLENLKKVTFVISEHCKKTAHHTKWPCLPYWHEVSSFHACRWQARQSQLVRVRSPRLLEQNLLKGSSFTCLRAGSSK